MGGGMTAVGRAAYREEFVKHVHIRKIVHMLDGACHIGTRNPICGNPWPLSFLSSIAQRERRKQCSSPFEGENGKSSFPK